MQVMMLLLIQVELMAVVVVMTWTQADKSGPPTFTCTAILAVIPIKAAIVVPLIAGRHPDSRLVASIVAAGLLLDSYRIIHLVQVTMVLLEPPNLDRGAGIVMVELMIIDRMMMRMMMEAPFESMLDPLSILRSGRRRIGHRCNHDPEALFVVLMVIDLPIRLIEVSEVAVHVQLVAGLEASAAVFLVVLASDRGHVGVRRVPPFVMQPSSGIHEEVSNSGRLESQLMSDRNLHFLGWALCFLG